jgi:hypothetical protein
MTTQNAQIRVLHQGLAPHDEAAMSRLFAFIARWQAARRTARLRCIQQIASKGLSAIE